MHRKDTLLVPVLLIITMAELVLKASQPRAEGQTLAEEFHTFQRGRGGARIATVPIYRECLSGRVLHA